MREVPDMNKIEFGQKVRELREKKHLTQMEFAEMIDITDKALSRIEVGRVFPHLTTLMAMANALDISLEFLVSEKKAVGKELYIDEIKKRVSTMEMYAIKHILEYIRLYSETEYEHLQEWENNKK